MRAFRLRDLVMRSTNPVHILLLLMMGMMLFLLPYPLLALRTPGGTPEDPKRRYFEETCFWVSGEFLDYFDANGGLEIFGYPISSLYNENGILVQYFQNARMEWHALNPDPHKLQLGLLGDELGLRKPPVRPPLSVGHVYFAETGHSVTYTFLRYFEAHGGVDLFGYPISEMLVENQKVVQYYQRLKLIWDPITAQMTVGNLGEIYVSAHRATLPTDVVQPASARIGSLGDPELRVAVGLSHPVVSGQQGQTVTAVVWDDRQGLPVPDARVRMTVYDDRGRSYPDLTCELVANTSGRVEMVIPLESIGPGSWLTLKTEASSGRDVAVDKDAFLVWW